MAPTITITVEYNDGKKDSFIKEVDTNKRALNIYESVHTSLTMNRQ